MFTFKPPSKTTLTTQKKNDEPGPGLWNGPKSQPHNKPIESVIGAGVHYQGALTGHGGVRIEGTFDGDINIKGPLVVGENAKITADIRAGAVIVSGHVKGNIVADKVELLSTGRVWGDLITTAFASEEGAFLRGQVRMEESLPMPAMPVAAEAPQAASPVKPTTAPIAVPTAPVIEIKAPPLKPQLQPEFRRA
jgi:cytoskeletal protein CcmA (bactofilin family)